MLDSGVTSQNGTEIPAKTATLSKYHYFHALHLFTPSVLVTRYEDEYNVVCLCQVDNCFIYENSHLRGEKKKWWANYAVFFQSLDGFIKEIKNIVKNYILSFDVLDTPNKSKW